MISEEENHSLDLGMNSSLVVGPQKCSCQGFC